MVERITEVLPGLKARSSACCMIIIVGGIFAELLVRCRLVMHGDAAATAHNIVTDELLYRLDFAGRDLLLLVQCAADTHLL
jgi:hypothetical protein